MNHKRITRKTALYRPVAVEDALLCLGDLHAVMGDGEVVVCGVEISRRVTVRVTVLKNCPLPTPLLVSDYDFMTIYSAHSQETACVGATTRMRDFLIDQAGMEQHDAGMLLRVAGDVRICQMVDPEMTCRMEVPMQVALQYGYQFL